jgi:beta-xylosidase
MVLLRFRSRRSILKRPFFFLLIFLSIQTFLTFFPYPTQSIVDMVRLIPILSLISLAWTAPLTKRSITGPVITSNFPDPSFIEVNGVYYAFATTNGAQLVPNAQSNDFVNWAVSGSSALTSAGSWSNGRDLWAPSVYQVNGQYVMYYSAQLLDGSTHCIGVATSSSPAGPYQPQGSSPVTCPASSGGAIDAFGYTDADGSHYLLYKVDGNSIGHGGDCNNSVSPIVPTPIMIQKMSSDGITTDGSAPIELLDRSDLDGPLIEAPSLMRVADSTSSGGYLYILFFSSNCYSGSLYDVSYAYSTNGILGPYTKAGYPVAPLLQTGTPYGQLYSPGGLTVGADGQHVVFHADQGTSSNVRQMYSGIINVNVGGRSVSI